MRDEGKVELPLNVDTKKYLFAKISFMDLLVISPAIVLSLIMLVLFKKFGGLSTPKLMLSLAPSFFFAAFQILRHPERKNISFLQYGLIWRIKYKNRNKDFFYTKESMDMADRTFDSRRKLGIKNVFSGCYETTDNRLVKVIEVSSINLSLMNKNEKQSIYESYRAFITELSIINKFQVEQIAQPINLTQYLINIDRQTEGETNIAKRMLARSYKRFGENIQKSREMVSRKRYFIIDHPISSDREKSIDELDKKTRIIESKLENMLIGQLKLKTKTLDNAQLTKLIYTTLDYDSSLSVGEYIINRANNKINFSVGENTAKELINSLEKQLRDGIN